jgi:hypothetical protein
MRDFFLITAKRMIIIYSIILFITFIFPILIIKIKITKKKTRIHKWKQKEYHYLCLILQSR